MEVTNKSATVAEIFETQQKLLRLHWIAGQDGSKRKVLSEESAPLPEDETISLMEDRLIRETGEDIRTAIPVVGYLNFIHPPQIQILCEVEMSYLTRTRNNIEDVIEQIFDASPACLIICNNLSPPSYLVEKCNEYKVPLLSSMLIGQKVGAELHYYISNLLADSINFHGVFMEIMSIGVLLTGPSGIGKSELALELINRGHRLISDDAPMFTKIAPDIINGTCPAILKDFLEVRGLGIINVTQMFGKSATRGNKYLRLIIKLQSMDDQELIKLGRLEGTTQNRKILNLEIPEITIPVTPGRNLAILVECAAQNYILEQDGYNATEELSQRQIEKMRKSSGSLTTDE